MAEIVLSNGLRSLVDADIAAEFGCLRWDPHSSSGHSTYAVRRVYMRGVTYWFRLHRVILDALPGQEVDHINGDGLDNRRCNLRLVHQQQNQMNRRAQRGSSRFKGVSWHSSHRKWRAQIRHNGSKLWLGAFGSEDDAARAYDAAALELFGPYARVNFSKEVTDG